MSEVWRHGFPVAGEVEALARDAEAWGYDGLLLADSECLQADVWVSLALAARVTTRLLLGPGVTNPVTRHAAVTASAAATLQAESGGRAVLGVGRGDSSVSQVGARPATVPELEEHVTTLRALLRGEQTASGRLAWLQQGAAAPPVEVAATGPRTIAAAARAADRVAFTVGADPERLRGAIAAARAAAPAGRPPRLGAYVDVACHEDPAAARELVRGSAAILLRFSAEAPGAAPEGDRAAIEAVDRAYDAARHGQTAAPPADALPDDLLDRFAVAGPPGHVAGRLRELLALGLDHLILVPGSRDSPPELLRRSDELLAAHVIPALRRGAEGGPPGG